MSYTSNGPDLTLSVISFGIIILIIAWIFVVEPAIYFTTQENVQNAKVTKVMNKITGESDTYLVLTKNESFKVEDSFLDFRFNSTDVWGRIEKGKCYDFRAWGFRWPFFSRYRNTADWNEVPCGSSQ